MSNENSSISSSTIISQVAVIGDQDTVICFKAIGFDTFILEKKEGEEPSIVANKIISILRKSYKIIYITESLYMLAENEIEQYLANKPYPILTIVPSSSSQKNIAFDSMKKLVERALGGSFF